MSLDFDSDRRLTLRGELGDSAGAKLAQALRGRAFTGLLRRD